MNDYTHYVITRFNLGVYDNLAFEYEKRGKRAPDPDQWSKYRFHIFKEYTYASISQQTSKSFTWLVLLDNKTPESIKEQMFELSSNCTEMELVYADFNHRSFFAANDATVQEYLRTVKNRAKYLYTSRVDGDDAINLEYVMLLQDAFSPEKLGQAITFQYGCSHVPQIKQTGCKPHGRSMFLTAVEEWDDNVKTVQAYSHLEWPSYCILDPNWREERVPMWLYCAHEQNLVNQFTGGDSLDISEVNRLFGTSLS